MLVHARTRFLDINRSQYFSNINFELQVIFGKRNEALSPIPFFVTETAATFQKYENRNVRPHTSPAGDKEMITCRCEAHKRKRAPASLRITPRPAAPYMSLRSEALKHYCCEARSHLRNPMSQMDKIDIILKTHRQLREP